MKLYKTGGKVDLSQFMPILESLGLRAVEEVPTGLLGDGKAYIHDFGVLDARGAVLDLETEAERVVDAITAMWRRAMRGRLAEPPGHVRRPRLARGADPARVPHATALRVSSRFTRSTATTPSPRTRTSRRGSCACSPRGSIRPARRTTTRWPRSARQILEDLREVASLDQDGILRNVLGTIDATVRTNAYLPDREYLSLKLRSADVPEMPKPFPLYEIFVYSPRVEAIHLRGGMVARGGIRWSDRREDYRTEVLGLMKAQTVKNSVIVPDGSKGGFVLKRASTQPDDLRTEVTERYVLFMQGLLDITDNLVKGEVVHPEGVRVLDGPDPYLVVAADKGTATFSDIANGVSQRYGFWLGDAFASGGSAGYDHKALGITARGAWESVKRHFRELGIDVMRDVFTVVGVGDMSGDVFGNGMLYTDRIRLVAAFDHRHVFVDPTPDPAASAAERRRLFELPRSSWADYDRSLLSEGGEVFDRSAKSVTPSSQVRAALGIPDDAPAEMQPNQLIRWALQAPVDLLWNGGIGTYVKHSDGDERRRRRPRERRRAHLRRPGPREGRRRGREPGLHPARADRVRAHRRPDQHGLHRQLRRRRHVATTRST